MLQLHLTVGSLNADILRYNADIISATLMIWGKLDENVSWVNTFPSLSSIFLHFIRQSLAYRVRSMLVHAVAPWISAHMMLFRGNGCHKCATTLILWGQRQFLGIFRIQQVYMMCMRFFVPFIICFHIVYNEPTQLPSSDSKNPILAVDERNTENVRSGYHYHGHWTHDERF